MSRHSKWAQIKHQKSAADVKRGKVFSLLTKKISLAAKKGKDADMNPDLRIAIEKAKEVNMPSDTIERAIKRGAGELKDQVVEEIIYEAYGPAGVQLIIRILTDNRNRTTANIRHLLNKSGGSLSGEGSVMWNFERISTGFRAKTTQEVSGEQKVQIEELLKMLEEDEDVEEIFTNLAV